MRHLLIDRVTVSRKTQSGTDNRNHPIFVSEDVATGVRCRIDEGGDKEQLQESEVMRIDAVAYFEQGAGVYRQDTLTDETTGNKWTVLRREELKGMNASHHVECKLQRLQ